MLKNLLNFKFFLIVFGAMLFNFSVLAQSNISSPYSRYGIGDINSRGFSQNDALGGLGIGLRNNKNLNIINPASYSSIDTLTFLFEFGLKNKIIYSETKDANQTKNDMNISYLAFGFPIAKWWFSSAGLLPFSSSGYKILENNNSGDIPKEILYSGSGGINKFYLGSTFKLHKTISIGINASYLFGTLQQSKTVRFIPDTTLYVNFHKQNDISINDYYLNFGVQYNNTISNKYQYTIGAVFDNSKEIKASRNSLVSTFYNLGGSGIVDTVYNTINERGSIKLPINYGIGFTFRTSQWLFGADYFHQNWSDSRFFGLNDSLANSNSYIAGAEFIPDKNSITKYWSKVSYRFGAHFSNTFLNFADKNEQIKDFGVSFGFGMPVKKSRSLFNISFEIGQRGTTSKNLVKETYGIISLNFTLTDIWFIKSKFD